MGEVFLMFYSKITDWIQRGYAEGVLWQPGSNEFNGILKDPVSTELVVWSDMNAIRSSEKDWFNGMRDTGKDIIYCNHK